VGVPLDELIEELSVEVGRLAPSKVHQRHGIRHPNSFISTKVEQSSGYVETATADESDCISRTRFARADMEVIQDHRGLCNINTGGNFSKLADARHEESGGLFGDLHFIGECEGEKRN